MNKKFTLIELLIVITIIAILTTMLLPSLANARVKAKAVVCKSNLKQVHIGIPLYADSNDDRFPDRVVNNKNSQYVWLGVTSDSLNASDPVASVRPITLELGLSMENPTLSIATCPTERGFAVQSKRGSSYGVNTWRIPNGISFKNSTHTGEHVTVESMSLVRDPSRMISFVEAGGFANAVWGLYNQSNHGREFNYNFARIDGSVTNSKISAMQQSSDSWTFNDEL